MVLIFPLVKEMAMKSFSTTIRYASMGVAVLMVTACATKDCVPPQGMASQTRPTAVTTSLEEEERTGPEKRAVLSLTGHFCEFYLPQVEAALERVPGVIGIDFKTVKGGAVVTYESGKLSPVALLSAVSSVKGDGYFCKGKVVPG
jgi:periplasmic mercuric ion binding protein